MWGRVVQPARPDPTELLEHYRFELYLAVRIKFLGSSGGVREPHPFRHNGSRGHAEGPISLVPQRKEKACITHAGVYRNLLSFNKLPGVGSCNLHDPTPTKITTPTEINMDCRARPGRLIPRAIACLPDGEKRALYPSQTTRFLPRSLAM